MEQISENIQKALRFAQKAHEGQIRKYTKEPYINHPIEVYKIVKQVTDNEDILISCILHDVVEDSEISIYDIYREFKNIIICNLVEGLTDLPCIGKTRAERKRINRERISKCGKSVKTIKLADIISNLPSVIKYDPKFAKKYVNEKRLQLKVLTDGNEMLYNTAKQIIDDYYEEK